MFSKSTPDALLVKVGADGYVCAEDVLYLRRSVFHDGVVSRDELEALFKLGERAPTGDREWAMFFEEAAADFYLREEEPQGYLTEDEFAHLKAQVTRDGEAASALELRLLVKIMETAVSVPKSMSGFVGEQLRRSMLENTGGVSAEDTGLVRRYVFAAGGDDAVAITRAEAELLFDINDAAQDNGGGDTAWTDFFVMAVANHLMAHIGYAAQNRSDAKRANAFAADHSANVGGVFSRMFSGGLGAAKGAFADAFAGDEKTAQGERNERRDRDIEAAEQVTTGEADWLAARIGRDGGLTASERALLQHMRNLGADLPANLKAIVDRAA